MDPIESRIQIALEEALLLQQDLVHDQHTLYGDLDSKGEYGEYEAYILLAVNKELGTNLTQTEVRELFAGDPTIGSLKKGFKQLYLQRTATSA